jgi:hypothetical protein
MKTIIRNILAVVIGWIAGSFINMTLINAGHRVFPIEGIDLNNFEELVAIIPHLDFNYFIFPFLAHAFGTLTGAFFAALIAPTHKMVFAFSIGSLFLIGGIIMCFLIPAPIWFIALDVLIAYIPMAWIGSKIAQKIAKN